MNPDAQFLYADRLGSITAIYNRQGAVMETNAYDEFGVPDNDNGGRFQYTGQQYVPELGLYYYKARMYSPRRGRFMQTDPIGYADGMNMYAYVGNDPVNFVDPMGLNKIVVDGVRPKPPVFFDPRSAREDFCDAMGGCGIDGFMPQDAGGVAGGGGGQGPQSVIIDESCAGVAAVRDPAFQRRALELPRLQAQHGREFGFFSAEGGLLRLRQRYNAPAFSSPDTNDNATIRARDMNANYFGDGWTVYAADVFIHSHRFSAVGGLEGDGDFLNAQALGLTVAAIQPNGRITCTTGKAP